MILKNDFKDMFDFQIRRTHPLSVVEYKGLSSCFGQLAELLRRFPSGLYLITQNESFVLKYRKVYLNMVKLILDSLIWSLTGVVNLWRMGQTWRIRSL